MRDQTCEESGIELTVDSAPSSQDLDRLRAGLTEHSLEFVERPGFVPIAVFARRNGELLGGAFGNLNWNWLDLSLLWVAESLRSRGLGGQLMAAIERAAWERGCRQAHLETFSYQALAFYESHGYEVFARLEDYAPDVDRYYLRKSLQDAT